MHGSPVANLPLVIVSVLATAVFWGTYGPFLQWGHGAMESGRMRPFICVGIAYVVVAVAGPILLISVLGMENEGGLFAGWTPKGIWWSFIAGVVGALGALGMLLAFNFGGKPYFVPPLIFGLAPVVNTAFTLSMNAQLREQFSSNVIRSSFFGAGLIMVAVGAVTVLLSVSWPESGKRAKESKASVQTESHKSDEDDSSESTADGKATVE